MGRRPRALIAVAALAVAFAVVGYFILVDTSPDTTPPTVDPTSPAEGSSTRDSTPTISGAAGTASGDLPTITVKIWPGLVPSGAPIQTLTTSASSGSWSIVPSRLARGTYSVRAKQSDTSSNMGVSPSHTFTIGWAYRDSVLTDNPGGYWRLGETSGTTAAGETGLNPGTYQNGVTLGQPGALTADTNKAASFDGVDDIVSVASSSSLSATTAVTVEAWVKRSKTGTWQNIVAKPGAGAAAKQNYALWLNTTNQVVAIFGNGTAAAITYSPPIDTNWHYLAATYDNTKARIYIDGLLQATTTSSIRLTANTQPITIGRTTDDLRMFKGVIDEVAVYRVVLSPRRIQLHYAKGNAIDTVAPAVTLTTPGRKSSTRNTSPHLAGSAGIKGTDSRTVRVKIYRGRRATGTPVQTLTTSWNTAGVWSVDASSSLPLGTYTAQAEQSDLADNLGLSTANTFSIVPPSSSSDPLTAGAGDIADCTDTGVNETADLILGLLRIH